MTRLEDEVTWLELIRTDPSLREFVAAEITRAGIELKTAKDNAQHWQDVAERLGRQVEAMKEKRQRKP